MRGARLHCCDHESREEGKMVKLICAMMVATAIPSAALATTCTARQMTWFGNLCEKLE